MDRSLLPLDQQIEYYLGKDRLPNLHWKPEIPVSWAILPKSGIKLAGPHVANSTMKVKEGVFYKFNNLGYRSYEDYDVDELRNKNLVLLLGDSDTFGRGVEYDNTYSTQLQKLNPDYYVLNLGICSISPDGMTRTGVQSILALGSAVKHVCVFWPILSSREFVSKTFAMGIQPSGTDFPYDDWWKHIDWVSNNYNYQKNKLLLEQTALSVGAQYHDLMINRYDKKLPMTYNELKSPGGNVTEFSADLHTAVANYFDKKIRNQPSLFETMQS